MELWTIWAESLNQRQDGNMTIYEISMEEIEK